MEHFNKVRQVNELFHLKEENRKLRSALDGAAALVGEMQRGMIARVRAILTWRDAESNAKLLRLAFECEAIEEALKDGREAPLETISFDMPSLGAKIRASEKAGRRAFHGEKPKGAQGEKATPANPWAGSFLACGMGEISVRDGAGGKLCLRDPPDVAPLRLGRETLGQVVFPFFEEGRTSGQSSPAEERRASPGPALPPAVASRPPAGPDSGSVAGGSPVSADGGFGSETAVGSETAGGFGSETAVLRFFAQSAQSESGSLGEAQRLSTRSASVPMGAPRDLSILEEKNGGFGAETAEAGSETAVRSETAEAGSETAVRSAAPKPPILSGRRHVAIETVASLRETVEDVFFPEYLLDWLLIAIEGGLDPGDLDGPFACLRSRQDAAGRPIGNRGGFARTAIARAARRALARWDADAPPPCPELAKLGGVARAPKFARVRKAK